MSKRALGFMNKSQPITYNTYIGGVSATISTDALLATKLGISVGRIENFTIVGSDIKCSITGGSYSIPIACFNNLTTITYYYDYDSLVSSLGSDAFSGTTNFKDFIFNGVTTIGLSGFNNSVVEKINLPSCTSLTGNSHFANCAKALFYYLPLCTTYGTSPSVNDGVFTNINPESIIYVHSSMATINAGGVEADLAYAISRGVTVRYVANFTAPSPVTDLAIANVRNTGFQLTFTAPSSTNAIDYYEVYIDGVYSQNIALNGYVRGLLPSTNYNNVSVKAIDIYYNKSSISNLVSTTTLATQTDAYPTTGLISYYKLDETSGTTASDSFGSNHLTNTNVGVNYQALIGKSYYSNTGSNNCTKTSATIGTVTNFTINVWCYKTRAGAGNGGVVEVGAYSGNGFGIWTNNIGQLSWRINGNYNHYSSSTFIRINTWEMVTIVYNGTDVRTYINAVLKQTTANTTNPAAATSIRLFARGDSVIDNFFGRLDEISIHNVALSPSDISLIYNNGLGITL